MNTLKKYISLPLIGYLIMASAVAYVIDQNADNARDARVSLAAQTYKTQLAGCGRTNDLRDAIRSILIASRATLDESVKKGEITEARAELAKAFYAEQIGKVLAIDCSKVYPKPGTK